MLYLAIQKPEVIIQPGGSYFDYSPAMPDDIILTDFSRRVIKDIDNCEVIDNMCIKSPIFGGISPKQLSAGTKNVLTLMYDQDSLPIDLAGFGENCYKFFPEISKVRDITLYLSIVKRIFSYGSSLEEAIILDTSEVVRNDLELICAYPIDTRVYNY